MEHYLNIRYFSHSQAHMGLHYVELYVTIGRGNSKRPEMLKKSTTWQWRQRVEDSFTGQGTLWAASNNQNVGSICGF